MQLLHNLLFVCLFNKQSGIAPLHIAVALPDKTGVEITELLLKAGANPNIRDCAFGEEENGRTPAHIACSREDNDQVQCISCIYDSDQLCGQTLSQSIKMQKRTWLISSHLDETS